MLSKIRVQIRGLDVFRCTYTRVGSHGVASPVFQVTWGRSARSRTSKAWKLGLTTHDGLVSLDCNRVSWPGEGLRGRLSVKKSDSSFRLPITFYLSTIVKLENDNPPHNVHLPTGCDKLPTLKENLSLYGLRNAHNKTAYLKLQGTRCDSTTFLNQTPPTIILFIGSVCVR